MASALDSQKIGSSLIARSYDHDPGATSAIVTSADGGTTKILWDASEISAFMAIAKPNIVGGNGITKLEIVAFADSAGAGTAYVIKDSGAVVADALDDNVVEECTVGEIAQIGTDNGVSLRYVGARITMATGTDEATVTYVGVPKRAYKDRTVTDIN